MMAPETLRRLRRSPGYAALTVATLGLGIGSATAVYSVISSIAVQPLPYPDSDRLVRLIRTVAAEDSPTGRPSTQTTLFTDMVPDLNAHLQSLSDIAGYAAVEVTVTGVDQPFRLAGARVSPEIFPLLNAVLARGRAFERGEQNVIVLSDRLWRSRFDGRPDVLGAPVALDGQAFAVVGVMASGFGFPDADTDVWVPLRAGGNFVDAQGILRANNSNGSLIGRLAVGVGLEAAAAEATPVMNELRGQFGLT